MVSGHVSHVIQEDVEQVSRDNRVDCIGISGLGEAFVLNAPLSASLRQVPVYVVLVNQDGDIVVVGELPVPIQQQGHFISHIRQSPAQESPKCIRNFLLLRRQRVYNGVYLSLSRNNRCVRLLHLAVSNNRPLLNASAINVPSSLFPLIQKVQIHPLGSIEVDSLIAHLERLAFLVLPLLDGLAIHGRAHEVLHHSQAVGVHVLSRSQTPVHVIPGLAHLMEHVIGVEHLRVQQVSCHASYTNTFLLSLLTLEVVD